LTVTLVKLPVGLGLFDPLEKMISAVADCLKKIAIFLKNSNLPAQVCPSGPAIPCTALPPSFLLRSLDGKEVQRPGLPWE